MQIPKRTTEKQWRYALLLFFCVFFAAPAGAQNYYSEDIRIPMAEAGERGLQALFLRPNGPGKFPLAIINHGAPRDPAERPRMSPYSTIPQALEFVRRGWAVAIVMRRGYGTSAGNYVEGFDCGRPDFLRSGATASADIRAAFQFLAKRADVNPEVMMSVGQSAGGFSSIALSANPPPGVIAVINFAGGRGSRKSDDECSGTPLIAAYGHYGKTSRIPTLWIYTENDLFFSPAQSRRFHEAFVNSGGNAQFVLLPRFGDDGHSLFGRGRSIWTPHVDDFLRKQNLPRRAELLPILVSVLQAPPKLSASGLRSFQDFLNAAPNKAFAVSPNGAFGWRSGRNTIEDARKEALDTCAKYAGDCQIYVVNEEIVTRLSPAAPGYAR